MAPNNILTKMCNFFILLCLIVCASATCPPESCGAMNVSYPFWIKNSSCGHPDFQINCTSNAPFLTALAGPFEILNISYSGYIIIDSTSLKAMSCNETDDDFKVFSLPTEGPFTISSSNRFAVVGCRSMGSFTDRTGIVNGRCQNGCLNQYDPKYCNTYACCESGIPRNWKFFNFTGGGIAYKDFPGVCGFSTILEPDTFKIEGNQVGFIGKGSYGLRLEWGVGEEDCAIARGTPNYSCAENAKCENSTTETGHVCICPDGYDGNGYLNGTGCTDVDECTRENKCVKQAQGGKCQNLQGSYSCSCAEGYVGDGFYNATGCMDVNECLIENKCVEEEKGGTCINFPGSYNCSCKEGYIGNGYSNSNGPGCSDVDECNFQNGCVEQSKGGICTNLPGSYNCSCKNGYIGNGFRYGFRHGFVEGTGCFTTSSNNVAIPAIIGSVCSFVGVSLAACVLFWCLKRRHNSYLRAKYFQQNGGIQLQQYIASRGARGTLKIYSATELERASHNYSTDMKLGSGGHGDVFKAIFPDGTLGAIKKSKEISDPHQDGDEFINELIILSQINHRNVVRLLGCCLETQYPLLVYEFVPNKTLREHIHSTEYLSWETRLRIAIETAEALAYLHYGASQPIFHRDVKSSNILLDSTYTPKVADFGISRLLNVDDTHLTTNVAGTMGYMDPEYFQSFQLTDRSDVYSFGVVLLELLTGLEPLSLERPRDECTLSGLFLSRVNSNSLREILDRSIMNGENTMQMKNMANLARECLHVEGKRRPSMKEVVEELVWIRGETRHRKSYPEDERSHGNNGKHKQIGTNDTAEIGKEKWVLGGGDFGESTSEASSVSLIQSFNIGAR